MPVTENESLFGDETGYGVATLYAFFSFWEEVTTGKSKLVF
jgi:hypothetical protein